MKQKAVVLTAVSNVATFKFQTQGKQTGMGVGSVAKFQLYLGKTTSVSHTPNPPTRATVQKCDKMAASAATIMPLASPATSATSFKNTTAFVLLFATAYTLCRWVFGRWLHRFTVRGLPLPAASCRRLTGVLHHAPRGQSSMAAVLRVCMPQDPSIRSSKLTSPLDFQASKARVKVSRCAQASYTNELRSDRQGEYS